MADNITLKNLGDIPVVEPNESTHLLAEQDGAYARVPKDKVGVTSWNDLQDRPFGEEKTVIEWDGVIGDRVCATIGDMVFFAKVADVPIPKAAFDGAKVTMIANGETQESVIAESLVEDKGGLLFVGGGAICVVENPGTYKVALMGGVSEYSVEFAEVGTYFMLMTAQEPPICVFCLEYITVKQLDPKYIPSSVDSGTLNVGVVLKDGVAASNCTYADIDAAITAGKPVFAVINSWMSDHWNTGCAQRITAVSDASLGNYYQVYFVAGDNDSYINIRFYENGTVEMEADE